MSISQTLLPGEYFIYETSAEEQKKPILINGSAFGVYSFGISNQGRVIGYDTGGLLFGKERMDTFQSKTFPIDVQPMASTVRLKNIYHSSTFNFEVDLTNTEFIKLYKLLGKDSFELPDDVVFVENNGTYNSCKLEITSQELVFDIDFDSSHLKSTLPFTELFRCERRDNYTLIIEGEQDIFATQLSIFFPNIRDVDKIIYFKSLVKNVHSVLEPKEYFKSVSLTVYFNETKSLNQEVYLVYGANRLKIFDKNNLTLLINRNLTDTEIFISSDGTSLLLDIGDVFFNISLRNSSLSETLNLFNNISFNQNNRFIQSAGTLIGKLNGQYYQENIDIAISDKEYWILSHDKQLLLTKGNLTDFSFETFEKYMIIKSEHEIAIISNIHSDLKDKLPFADVLNGALFALGMTDEPYLVEYSNQGLKLYQSSNDMKYSFTNKEVMKVKFYGVRKGILQQVSIGDFYFYLSPEVVKQSIYQSYIALKTPVLRSATGKTLYTSAVRQMGDYILYEYFGQLFVLQDGLEELKQDKSEERIKDIVNYLYYGIRSQRKRVDQISIYLPSLLSKMEEEVFQQVDVSYADSAFKKMQTRLINITSQLNRNLAEVESNLSAISSSLIPMETIDKVIEDKKEKGYTTAVGAGLAVGALTIFTAGATLPLLLGPGIMALNTKNNADSMQMQEEIRKGNEQNRERFYANKVLDAFQHFVDTMIPYYITQINEVIYSCYKELSEQYETIIDKPFVKASLFHKVAELYTIKQLPIDESIEMNRQELIAVILDAKNIINHHGSEYHLQRQFQQTSTNEIVKLLETKEEKANV